VWRGRFACRCCYFADPGVELVEGFAEAGLVEGVGWADKEGLAGFEIEVAERQPGRCKELHRGNGRRQAREWDIRGRG
jgi:hypothetical protein